MKLPKAIEISEDLLQTSSREKSPDSWDALRLLIEAGKRVKIGRGQGYEPYIDRLPGETEE